MTKTILIPSRLNPVSEPPEDDKDVIVELEDGTFSVGYYYNSRWLPSNVESIVGSDYEIVEFDGEIKGWAAILKQ